MSNLPAVQINPRYQLQQQIGQGGMGFVFRAYDRLRQETVALKQVRVSASSLQFKTTGTNAAVALAQEFRTLAGLRHPHIVAVLDYGFDGEQHPYYTMQLLAEARPLNDYAAKLDTPRKVQLVIDTLQALVYLHRRGIIHRDLKPSNVMVMPNGQVQVLDFGLAIAADLAQQADDDELAGTLGYMAPETLYGDPITIAADLYAVGVMLYELFAGHRPYRGRDVGTFLAELVAGAETPPPLDMIPLALQPVVARLLRHDPEERYPSAAATIDALTSALGLAPLRETDSVRESFLQASTFVGRKAELQALKDAFDATQAGQGSLWLVGGESGVGKSRLLDELRTHALVKGALVLRGQAVAEGGLPFQLWRNVAQRLVLTTALSDLQAGILKAIVPDIETLLARSVPDAPPLDGAAGQQRLVLTLLDLLKAQGTDVVLLLEDLQWATESLAPLQQILAVHEHFPHLLVVGTFRDDECPDLPETLSGMQVLSLSRLHQDAVVALASSMLGETGNNPALIELLQRETEGNVFFMVETVRELATDAGALAAIGQGKLPDKVFAGGVQQIIQRRLARLPAEYWPLLQHAAVAGRALDTTVLSRLTPTQNLHAFLAAGADASIFEIADDVWRFSHDKLREAVLLALSDGQQRTLNQAVAQAIEASYPDDDAYHEVLLEHWRLAGQTEYELRYLLSVVQQLTEVRPSYQRATALAVRGLALLPQDDSRRVTLLNLQGELHWRQGDYDEAERLSQQALLQAESNVSVADQLISMNNLGVVAAHRGNFDGATHYFEQGLALSTAHNDLHSKARNLNNLGNVATFQGNYAAARTYYADALSIRRQIGDQYGIGVSLNSLGEVTMYNGEFAASQGYVEQSLVVFREIGHKFGIAIGLLSLATVAVPQGNYDAAQTHCKQGLAIFRELGSRLEIAISLGTLGNIAVAQGNHQDAREHYAQSLALYRELGYAWGIAATLRAQSELAFEDAAAEQIAATLYEGLATSLRIQATTIMLELLVTSARLLARAEDFTQAALVAGLVAAHPATQHHLRDTQLAKLKAELRAVFSTTQLAPMMQQGAELDLETTARDMIARPLEQIVLKAFSRESLLPPLVSMPELNPQEVATTLQQSVERGGTELIKALIAAAQLQQQNGDLEASLQLASAAHAQTIGDAATSADNATRALQPLLDQLETLVGVETLQAALQDSQTMDIRVIVDETIQRLQVHRHDDPTRKRH